jgi:hypothetical protein
MAFVVGDIVASDDVEFPYKVVFKKGDEVVVEWLAKTSQDAEEQIIEALEGLGDQVDVLADGTVRAG